MTPRHFHTTPTSCAIQVDYAHHKTLYMHIPYSDALNEQGTALLTPVFHQSISTTSNTNKISQHNLNSNIPYRRYSIHSMQTQHCSWTSQFLHTGKTDHTYQAQYTKYIAVCSRPQYNPVSHNITQSPCTSTYTPSTTHHTASTTLCTQLTNTQTIFV